MDTPRWPAPEEPLPIRVRPQSGEVLLRPSVTELGALVEGIGADNRFLVLERVPHVQRVFIQEFRDEDDAHVVEYRDGGRQMYAATVDDPADVLWVLVVWALDAPAWRTGVDWKVSYTHPEVEVTPLAGGVAEAATAVARRCLDVGYLTFEEMAESIATQTADGRVVTIEQAESLLEPLWVERVAEQSLWPEVTDADRVDAALSRLGAAGVRARAHFHCCVTCGTGGMYAEDPGTDHGYVFFHSQDAEHAVSGELYLSFGSYAEMPDQAAAVGREVVAALTEQGLSTRWDGTAEQRIAVVDLNWRKRLE